jgi:catechol 2,3-dioxygenase-like lactoylglutathione lyase family enzyme
VLSQASFHAAIPCSDLDRAKRFYAEKLGLTPSRDTAGGAFYAGANGTQFLLFPSGGRASGTHTQMGFRVADAEAEVKALKDRGVEFEEYEFPGFDKSTSIATTGPAHTAWFKDSEGNLLGVVQLDE